MTIFIISTYQERISAKPFVHATTYRRVTLGAKVVPNNFFLAFLLSDHDVGIQFLNDVRLIPRSVVHCKCGSHMSWWVDVCVKDS